MNIIQKIILNFIGKKIESNLFSKESSMDTSKKWYQSKTILAGIMTFLVNMYVIFSAVVAPNFGLTLPPIPEWLLTVLNSIFGTIVVYGRTTAETKIG